MKCSTLAIVLIGLLAGRTALAQSICAGAAGSSTACAPACSGTVVNDNVSGGGNNGKFDVGNGNQGDGNDGFNNVGNFNVGSGNEGNCILNSGQITGSCDPSNTNGQIVLRFCHVYPNDQKCQPGGYLAEYSQAMIAQVQQVVASCNGGASLASPPTPPTTTTTSLAAAPPTPTPPVPTATVTPQIPVPPVSASQADLETLAALLFEHIQLDRASGRKLLK